MESLAVRIARDGPLQELDAVGWAIRLAKRLEALHALAVAHGAISPACIVTASTERNAKAYIADGRSAPRVPSFHSPERILGGEASTADDIWAVAATLYAALTGADPFSGATEAELEQKILAASPPPLSTYDIGDDDLQRVLDDAFLRDIKRRTTSVSALRHALEEWHPDPNVANLPSLEDEDAGEEEQTATRSVPLYAPKMLRTLDPLEDLPQAALPFTPAASEEDPPATMPLPATYIEDEDSSERLPTVEMRRDKAQPWPPLRPAVEATPPAAEPPAAEEELESKTIALPTAELIASPPEAAPLDEHDKHEHAKRDEVESKKEEAPVATTGESGSRRLIVTALFALVFATALTFALLHFLPR